LLRNSETSYMLIKDRDRKKLHMISRQWIVLAHSSGNTTWNLVELKKQPPSEPQYW